MATYYFRSVGTIWGQNSSWSLSDNGPANGLVPTGSDTAIFTSNSSTTCSVTSTVGCLDLITTGYVGNINITGILSISGNASFNTGMTVTGSGVGILSFNGINKTVTSNGVYFNVPTTRLAGSSTNITLIDPCTVNNFGFQGSNCILNGSVLNINNNLTITIAAGAGSTLINLIGTGIWSGNFPIRNSLTIKSTANLTISGSVGYNTGVLTNEVGSTVNTTGSTLNINGSATLNTDGILWSNITFPTTTSTINLTSDLTSIGTIDFPQATITTTISGSTLKIRSLIHRNGNSITGTSLFLFNGTGTFNGITTGAGIANSITIDTVGNLSLIGNIIVRGGIFTYLNGNVNAGTSVFRVSGTVTLHTNGINFYRIISNNTSILTLTSNLTATNSVSLGTSGNITLNGSIFYVGGSLSIINNATISGTTNIILNGTGIWSCNLVGIVKNNLTIDTAGTITISGIVYYDTETLLYLNGTVNTTGSTLNVASACTFNTTSIAGTISWNNVIISTGIQTINSLLTIAGTLTVGTSNNVTFSGTSGFTTESLSVTTPGRIITLASGKTYNVTNNLNLVGTNASRITLTSSTPRAIFTLPYGATQNVKDTSATNIDSSLGQTILSSAGVLTNTLNWSIGSGNFFLMF